MKSPMKGEVSINIRYCAYCGAPLGGMDAFCSKCGKKVDSSFDIQTITTPAPRTKKFPLKLFVGLLGALLCCMVAIFWLLIPKGPNFRMLYQTYCKTYWSTVGLDGSYLYIDTNPNDEESNGIAYPEAAQAIKDVNEELGLPESVLNDMQQTTFLDGQQTQVFEKQKLSVSWRYHPDKGLEVTYKKLD